MWTCQQNRSFQSAVNIPGQTASLLSLSHGQKTTMQFHKVKPLQGPWEGHRPLPEMGGLGEFNMEVIILQYDLSLTRKLKLGTISIFISFFYFSDFSTFSYSLIPRKLKWDGIPIIFMVEHNVGNNYTPSLQMRILRLIEVKLLPSIANDDW